MKQFSRAGGFTLVEVIVMLTILGVLAAAVIPSIREAKMSARDKERMADLEQIRLALRLYKDSNGAYPECDSSMVIGEGQALPGGCAVNIDTALAPYLAQVPADPRRTVSGYDYIYDSDYDCRSNGNGSDEIVVYARTVEKESTKNWGRNPTVEGVCEPIGPLNDIYGIILGPEVP